MWSVPVDLGPPCWLIRPGVLRSMVQKDLDRHPVTETTAIGRTGFGPQFTDGNQTWPGPGNNSFNEFAMTRAYLDFRFSPVDDFTMRIVPDMYAMVNTGTTRTASSTSKSSGGNHHYHLDQGHRELRRPCRPQHRICPDRRRQHGSPLEIRVPQGRVAHRAEDPDLNPKGEPTSALTFVSSSA